MRGLAIALVIAGCSHWRNVPTDDVRTGRIRVIGDSIKVWTIDGATELRVEAIHDDALLGTTSNGTPMKFDFSKVWTIQVSEPPSGGQIAAWVIVGVLLLAGAISFIVWQWAVSAA